MTGVRRTQDSRSAVGEAIRRARLRAGISQRELAQAVALSQPVVSRWEQGYDSPSVDELLRIARVTGADPVLMLAQAVPGAGAGLGAGGELANRIAALSERERATVVALVEMLER